jgi:plasmid stabilization system protein ParE
MAKIKIVWNTGARNSFRKYLSHIKKDSLQSAGKVKDDVLMVIGGLVDHPEKHPPDRFKKDNNGNFRAFEKHSCRVAYYIAETEIRILRVRHVKQEPKEY